MLSCCDLIVLLYLSIGAIQPISLINIKLKFSKCALYNHIMDMIYVIIQHLHLIKLMLVKHIGQQIIQRATFMIAQLSMSMECHNLNDWHG
jgi:hypothetical protein